VFSSLYGLVIDSTALSNGFFQGYNVTVALVIICQAAGGLIIAVVVKYADNIIKGFGSAISIILSSIMSIFLFNYNPSLKFVLGTALVIIAVFFYSYPNSQPRKEKKVLQVQVY